MTNLLKDSKFRKGFMLKGLNSIRDGNKSIYDFKTHSDIAPDWFLCQWNSKYNLAEGGVLSKSGESFEISDRSKSIASDGTGGLTFVLNANEEYDSPRLTGQPWPHLLIEQDFEKKHRISDLKKINLNCSFKLVNFTDYLKGSAQHHHTAQFVWVVVLGNENPLSKNYGRIIWVVFCLFDSRYEFVPLFTEQDSALPDGDFIYSFEGQKFIDTPLSAKETVNMDFDLYPHIEGILQTAQKCGFMTDTGIDDLVLKNTNMGFEITGTYDAAVTVKDIGIHI